MERTHFKAWRGVTAAWLIAAGLAGCSKDHEDAGPPAGGSSGVGDGGASAGATPITDGVTGGSRPAAGGASAGESSADTGGWEAGGASTTTGGASTGGNRPTSDGGESPTMGGSGMGGIQPTTGGTSAGGEGTCVPRECNPGVDCGTIDDGCGDTVDCGDACTGENTCGGGGTPLVCGHPGSSELFNNGSFIMAVQSPDPDRFALWADRGMNVIAGPGAPGNGSGGSVEHYVDLIRQFNTSQGRTVYRIMHSPLDGETSGGDILAWEQTVGDNDEPDAFDMLGENLPTLQSQFQTWKARDAAMPVWLNLSGTNFINATSDNYLPDYETAFDFADWISFDVYPWGPYNSWLEVNGASIFEQGSVIGLGLDKIRWMTDKPALAYLQSGPTTDAEEGRVGPLQVRVQMWLSVIHGARGVIFWIANGDHNFDDCTPDENGDEIGATAGWMNSLSAVLCDEIIEPETSGPEDAIGVGTIHVGGRVTSGVSYYFALNASEASDWMGHVPLAGAEDGATVEVWAMPSGWPGNSERVTTYATVESGGVTDTLLASEAKVYVLR